LFGFKSRAQIEAKAETIQEQREASCLSEFRGLRQPARRRRIPPPPHSRSASSLRASTDLTPFSQHDHSRVPIDFAGSVIIVSSAGNRRDCGPSAINAGRACVSVRIDFAPSSGRRTDSLPAGPMAQCAFRRGRKTEAQEKAKASSRSPCLVHVSIRRPVIGRRSNRACFAW